VALFEQGDRQAMQSQAAGINDRISSSFSSPWLDPAGDHLPSDWHSVLRFCEKLWYMNGIYAQALTRMAAYFVTKIKIDDVEGTEKERWGEYIEQDLGLTKWTIDCARNYNAYGDVKVSPMAKITRLLRCGKCRQQIAPIREWDYKFERGKFATMGRCPRCKQNSNLERVDYRSTDRKKIHLHIWNPYTISLKHNEITGSNTYYYKMPSRIKGKILSGDIDMLEDTPWEFVECAMSGKPLMLYPDSILHLRDVPLAGVNSGGNGLPRAMSNHRQAYLMQAYKRLNMVMALEYSAPLRSLSVDDSIGNVDPTMGADFGDIQNKLSALIADWKRDPAAIHISPVPIRYSAWGGEGFNMVRHEQQRVAMEELLTGLGVPVDFFVGTFRNERAAGQTLRLMERSWQDLVSGLNMALSWVADVTSDLLGWTKPKLSLESTTTSDNEYLHRILLDLWAQNKVSGRTAMRPLDIDPIEEQKQLIQETVDSQEVADRAKIRQDNQMQNIQQFLASPEEQQQQAAAGGGGAPGSAVGTGPMANTPIRPDELMAQAQQMAEQLMAQPEPQRRQALANLRREQEVLHAAVLREMDKLRSRLGTEAVNSQSQQ